ncbi:MAG: hypothetical protein AB8B61_04165 [Cyclobacteriaceae bacterium]
MNKILLGSLVLATALLFSSCKKEDDTNTSNNPTSSSIIPGNGLRLTKAYALSLIPTGMQDSSLVQNVISSLEGHISDFSSSLVVPSSAEYTDLSSVSSINVSSKSSAAVPAFTCSSFNSYSDKYAWSESTLTNELKYGDDVNKKYWNVETTDTTSSDQSIVNVYESKTADAGCIKIDNNIDEYKESLVWVDNESTASSSKTSVSSPTYDQISYEFDDNNASDYEYIYIRLNSNGSGFIEYETNSSYEELNWDTNGNLITNR